MFKIITIPFNRKTELFDVEEVNKFVFNKKIKNYQVQSFQNNGKNYWTIFLEYELLLEPDKLFYEIRKDLALKGGDFKRVSFLPQRERWG